MTILIAIIFINNDVLAYGHNNSFEEYYLLQKYSKYVKKDKNGFKIYATNGKVTELKIYSDKGYSFEDYLSNIGYFVFEIKDIAYEEENQPEYPFYL